MAYKNISDKITISDDYSEKVTLGLAYVERGVVCITLILRSGASGVVEATINSTQYFPRTYVINGIYASPSTSDDAHKVISAQVRWDGIITLWIKGTLLRNEPLSFVYPMRSL